MKRIILSTCTKQFLLGFKDLVVQPHSIIIYSLHLVSKTKLSSEKQLMKY